MEIFFCILAVLSLIFCSVVVVDKTIFDLNMRKIDPGMTGKEIERETGRKVTIVSIEKDRFYARIVSPLTLFRYRLIFINGKLVSKQRD